MDEKTRDALAGLLRGHAGQAAREGATAQAALGAEDAFRERFKALEDAVIFPAMREVGEALRARGHDYEMGEGTVAQGGASGDEVTARMAFRIDWQGMDARGAFDTPFVLFYPDCAAGLVRVMRLAASPHHGTTSGPGSKAYGLEDITPAAVQAELMEVLRESLRGPGGDGGAEFKSSDD